nr:transporter substrate-binding domain-containing protein [Actinomycetota bacterium]
TVKINGLADLCGLTVAVEAGSLEDTTATTQSQQCTASGKKAIQIQRYQTENENLLALTSGRAQVSTAGSQIIPYLVQQSNGALKSVGTPYSMAPLGIEFPQSAPAALLQAFQGALNKMVADGTYGRIMAKWGQQANLLTQAQILPASAAG